MRNFIKNIICKLYLIGRFEATKREKFALEQSHKRSAFIGEGTLIGNEAILQNSQDEKSKINIGKRCQIKGHLMIFKHGGEIAIGDDTLVAADSKIWSAKKISVGNRVLISHNVNIHDNISHPLNAKARHEDFVHIFSVGGFQDKIDLREKEIVIGDDVWIGFNSTIMKGVTIGKGAIIGSNTIVTKDVPEFAVVVGNPATIIKYVN